MEVARPRRPATPRCPSGQSECQLGRLLGKLARFDVLLLDNWGLAPSQDQERRDLLEILEDRYGARATIVTSQHPPTQCHDLIGEPSLADAICGRLLHNAYRLVLKNRCKPFNGFTEPGTLFGAMAVGTGLQDSRQVALPAARHDARRGPRRVSLLGLQLRAPRHEHRQLSFQDNR